MNNVFRNLVFITALIALAGDVHSQTPNPLDFFPHHAGDVWQYRSQFTGKLIGTDYMDSIRVDSLSRNTFIYYRPVGGGGFRYRIDSVGNLYNLNFQAEYPRYKLSADSGESWIAGYDIFNGDTLITYRVSVGRIYQSVFFGVPAKVKVFRFEMIQFAGTDTFWLGNDYLAAGFGLVQEDIEPSDVYVLAGAIIDSARYGTIVSVKEQSSFPQSFDLLGNYPNPFNNATMISYSISKDADVKVILYDILGREVKTLVDERKRSGSYNILFTAEGLTSGIYFVMLKTESNALTHRLLLLK